MEAVYLAAIIQGCLLTLLLLTWPQGDQLANRLIALLVGLLTLSLWNLYSYKQGLPGHWRLIDHNGWYSPLFWGPALYLYTRSLTVKESVAAIVYFKHFSFGLFFFASATLLSAIINQGWITTSVLEGQKTIQLLAFFIQISLYIYASFQLTQQYSQRLKDRFSDPESRDLTWLQRLIAIFAALIALDMFITVPSVLQNIWPIPYLDYYLLAEAVAIYFVAYCYVMRIHLLPNSDKPKYQSSPLNNQSSQLLLNELLDVMKRVEPYRNPGLKLNDLAELIDVHPHYLSQLINEQLEKNFYDFVNSYRTELSKTLLVDNKETNITQIAYESGFNNRASFNKVFKNQTGMTPSQFRKSAFTQPEVSTDTV